MYMTTRSCSSYSFKGVKVDSSDSSKTPRLLPERAIRHLCKKDSEPGIHISQFCGFFLVLPGKEIGRTGSIHLLSFLPFCSNVIQFINQSFFLVQASDSGDSKSHRFAACHDQESRPDPSGSSLIYQEVPWFNRKLYFLSRWPFSNMPLDPNSIFSMLKKGSFEKICFSVDRGYVQVANKRKCKKCKLPRMLDLSKSCWFLEL